MSLDLKEQIAYLIFAWHCGIDCSTIPPRRPNFLDIAGQILDLLGDEGLPVADTAWVERWLAGQ